MDKVNLTRMRDHLLTLDEDSFDMYNYSQDVSFITNIKQLECNSVGCILGHCAILDKENVFKNFINYEFINYEKWAENFIKISSDSLKYKFLFSSFWADYDNTLKGAIERINVVLSEKRIVEKDFPTKVYVKLF